MQIFAGQARFFGQEAHFFGQARLDLGGQARPELCAWPKMTTTTGQAHVSSAQNLVKRIWNRTREAHYFSSASGQAHMSGSGQEAHICGQARICLPDFGQARNCLGLNSVKRGFLLTESGQGQNFHGWIQSSVYFTINVQV